MDLWLCKVVYDRSLPCHICHQIEVVGSVEAGIKAAQWSPDEELLVLVTGTIDWHSNDSRKCL